MKPLIVYRRWPRHTLHRDVVRIKAGVDRPALERWFYNLMTHGTWR